ncbi:MAG: SusD/RagB family nutrient-binding outer membrane lipoprotein [Bacteroidota bacterium]
MNKIFKYITIITLIVFSACTENFEELNTNPYQISDASLRQDNNHVGAYFPTMLGNIFGDQIEHNLAHDSWVRHLGTPTPFVGGINNTTYYIRWNTYWNRCYNQVFSLSGRVIEIAEAEGNDVFVAWAKLIRILSASRLSAYHGPIIYTNYGSLESTILYDSEETLYNTWFSELDDIVATLTANSDFGGMAAFDASYGGDIPKWIKFANSLRLRLAMRISVVSPTLAKAEGEKAIAAAGGLIMSAADDFKIKLYNGFFPPARIAWGWGDTRMSATMESVLVGYEDGRLSKYFEPATDVSLASDHPDLPYKGIRNGATLGAKDDRLPYSNISKDFNPTTKDGMRRCFMSAETHFLLAEAALRGWTGAGSAQAHYEQGVMDSFAEWGAAGAADYLMDDTKMPIDYDDPKAGAGDVNDFRRGETDPRLMLRWDITVKWDDAASNEEKLERIISQKWIAAYMNSIEPWVDHRRTGYPKLPYNYQNDSNEDWGIVAADDFLRRLPFVDAERNNNAAGVADATTKLGGPDEIGTPLWFDTGGTNFP